MRPKSHLEQTAFTKNLIRDSLKVFRCIELLEIVSLDQCKWFDAFMWNASENMIIRPYEYGYRINMHEFNSMSSRVRRIGLTWVIRQNGAIVAVRILPTWVSDLVNKVIVGPMGPSLTPSIKWPNSFMNIRLVWWRVLYHTLHVVHSNDYMWHNEVTLTIVSCQIEVKGLRPYH
jgi:hypothetical protein